MKIRLTSLLYTLIIGAIFPVCGWNQNPYIKQVISTNSGKFEFTPPYQDYVTVQSNNPVTGAGSVVHNIFTQSSQDIVIQGNVAYIAAQDTLIKLNPDTYQRLGAIADSGLSKILVFGNKLIVSKQYPVSKMFAEVLNANDLSLVATIPGIPGDCGGMVAAGDSVYIAVNGGWMGTEGKIAVVETSGWTVKRIINLGSQAIGIQYIYKYGNKLITVNKSPYSTPDAGSISVYNLSNFTINNVLLNKNVGISAGIEGHLLYFAYNYGIGSFNLNTLQLENPAVVPDPGSSLFRYITSAAIDTLNNRIFVNVGDYIGPGTCRVSSLSGDSLFSYSTGISTDAIAVDYRMAALGISNPVENPGFSIWPNPVSDKLNISLNDGKPIDEITITDIFGRTVVLNAGSRRSENRLIDVASLVPGIYLINVRSSGKLVSGKFFKK